MIRAWHAIPVAVAVAAATTLATVATGQQGTSPSPALAPPSITVNGSASVATSPTVDDNTGPTVNDTTTTTTTTTTDATDNAAAYQAALGQALAAAKAKAQFVASQEGVTLGALQDVTEQSDAPNGNGPCGPVAFANASSGVAAPSPSIRHKTKAKTKTKTTPKTKPQLLGGFAPSGRAASATGAAGAHASLIVGCTLDAQVTVTYLIAGPATTTATSTSQSTTAPSTSTSVTATTTSSQG